MSNGNNAQLDIAMLDEPSTGRLTIQYAPDDSTEIVENPPRFSWLPVIEDEAEYVVRISKSAEYAEDETWTYPGLKLNFFTPDVALPDGKYVWSYAVWSSREQAVATNWSIDRSFKIRADLPETPVPLRAARFDKTETSHPRLWLTKAGIKDFKAALKKDPSHCTWDVFFEKSVAPWMDRAVMNEPVGYPNHQRVASVWRQTYIDCQELIYAIRHLAVGGAITENAELTVRAKEWLLETASWNPAGTTSRAYTDEWAFRLNLALAWGYDWLFDELTEEERDAVREALTVRTRETANHIIKNANIQLFPFDSHAVRAVSAVLIPSSIALLGHEDEAEDWLNYAIEFLMTVYSPWGDHDGGWAEGPHYWMTGMAYLIDAANLLRSFTGIDLYQRPFFQKTGDFPLFTKAPDTRRATFGDDSTMGDLPSLKIGYNLRQFAGVTGNGAYQWYYDVIRANDPGTEMAFYNYGWWDLNFDELAYRTDFPVVETEPLGADDTLRWFKGIGWAAIQTQMADPSNHIQFVMKSSPYGSISHSHGDQNAFCLAAFGEDLAIQSGHYVAFNSSMHQKWRRQTRSKNGILINGKGQYAGKDKAKAMQSSGNILVAEQREDHVYIQGDATKAYRGLSPEVTQVLRDVYFVNKSYFVIVDTIDANKPVSIDWLLHANGEMTLSSNTFRYSGERAGFYGQVLWSEAGAPTITQNTGFPDVDPEDYDGLPVSTCLTASFPSAIRHRIATLLVPYPIAAPRRIFSFLDDQGYDCDLYFTDSDDQTFKVVVPKTFDVGN
ncbi:MAG: DUF4962 domain-containing protein [Rhizobiaceae bacterium]